MAFVEWSDAVSVYVEEIDEQHKKLFEMINRAHEVDWDECLEDGQKLLNELIEFTRVHFTTEENYFERCGYPGAKVHIQDHVTHMLMLLELWKNCENKVCTPQAVLSFLKAWWDVHLVKMDHKYVENFRACGLK